MKNVIIVTRSKSGETEHYPLLKMQEFDPLPQSILDFCRDLFLAPLESGIGLNEEQVDEYARLYSAAVNLDKNNEYYKIRLRDSEPEEIENELNSKDVEKIYSCFKSENCKSWISGIHVNSNPSRIVEGECEYNVSMLMWNFSPFDKVKFIYHSDLLSEKGIVANRMALVLAICNVLYPDGELPKSEKEKALLIIHDEEWGVMPQKTTYLLSEFSRHLNLEGVENGQVKNPNDDYVEQLAKLTDEEICEYSKYISQLEVFKHAGTFWDNVNEFNFANIVKDTDNERKEKTICILKDLFKLDISYKSIIYQLEYKKGKFVIPEYYNQLGEGILKLLIAELEVYNVIGNHTIMPDFACYIVYHSNTVIVNPPQQYLFAQEVMEYTSMNFNNSLMKNSEKEDGKVVAKFYSDEDNVRKYGVFKNIQTNKKRDEQWTQNMIMLPMVHLCSTEIRNSSWPRYKNIVDSSIWNYYVPAIESDNGIMLDIERLYSIWRKIAQNTFNRLYKFSIGREYANLNARLTREAYILRMDSGHEKFVSPFVFHSESEIEKALTENLSKTKKGTFNAGVKWRFLLLDDYADKALKELYVKNTDKGDDFIVEQNTTLEDGINYKRVKGKLKIIIDDLKTRGCTNIVWCCPTEKEIEERFQKGINKITWRWFNQDGYRLKKYTDPDVTIVCARDIKDALYLMILQRYDLILLDYLLDSKNDCAEREYSYYLLKIIDGICRDNVDESLCAKFGIRIKKEGETLNYRIQGNDGDSRCFDRKELVGPDGRLYFMHISAFVFAIQERLQEQHLLRSEPFWHITRGACPTNTPELFLYYLYRAMEKRHEAILKQGDETIGSLIDFLNKIFEKNPRMQSVNKFSILLNLRAQYDRIKKDVYKEERELLNMKAGDEFINGCSPLDCRSSRLICSTFEDILRYGNSFWEHLQHLIYLTAYGTIRQWTEMWEEYTFIKPKLELSGDKGKKVCKAIENYIIDLKSNT